ncbi:Uncharacterised protein [Cedecea neteri]|uniref:Uncharacterized protein n=1 Tax=Cedecea neteri TaxID=158822 RepID=A0A2X2T5L8_9ENTR|nr:Uncharacterised protein [Cedecea neteri]
MLPTSQNGETPLWVASTWFAAAIITAKPAAANRMPITNFVMLLGFKLRLASDGQNQLNTGASRIINSALIDWNQMVGISKLPIWRSV